MFGPPPPNHATSSLPQHGFARSCYWEFLGKSSSESLGKGDHQGGDGTVMLDFGLSHTMLGEDFRKAWPHEFGLVYTVTLAKNSLQTSLKVQNEGRSTFEFQVLMHTYLRVDVSPYIQLCTYAYLYILSAQDISTIRVKHLESKTYIDKTQDAAVLTESSPAVAIDKETDRIYQSLDPTVPIVVATEDGQTVFSLTRESLSDVVLWNPWVEKAKGMADFGPAEAYKNMICVEAGSVVGWQLLDTGDSWEGGQTVRARM